MPSQNLGLGGYFCLPYELSMAALVWLPAIHKHGLGFAAWFNPELSAWGKEDTSHTTSRLPKCSQIPLFSWITALPSPTAKGRACTPLTWKALCCCHLGTGVGGGYFGFTARQYYLRSAAEQLSIGGTFPRNLPLEHVGGQWMGALCWTSGCSRHFWEVESLGTTLPLSTEL